MITDDPNHPDIKRGGPDEVAVPMNKAYLVLSEEERHKGFVRPVRRSYVHVGTAGPKYALRDLHPGEQNIDKESGYVKYEEYPENSRPMVGRFWKQEQLDNVGKGCGVVTTMGVELAETYARDPWFYGSTYCGGCRKHRPVGQAGEFVWEGTTERVGT